jgi:hypothetical protein
VRACVCMRASVCGIFFLLFVGFWGTTRRDGAAVATRGDSQSVSELIGSTFGASEAWLFLIWIRRIRVVFSSASDAYRRKSGGARAKFTAFFLFCSACATRAENGRFIYYYAFLQHFLFNQH